MCYLGFSIGLALREPTALFQSVIMDKNGSSMVLIFTGQHTSINHKRVTVDLTANAFNTD